VSVCPADVNPAPDVGTAAAPVHATDDAASKVAFDAAVGAPDAAVHPSSLASPAFEAERLALSRAF
jgi:hypothetical protein